MKQIKFLIPIAVFSFFIIAHQAEASLTVGSNSVTGSGAVTIQPASGSNLNITLATTGDFAVNTNQLYVDTSTGNVGIGTSTPFYKLYSYDLHTDNVGSYHNAGFFYLNESSTVNSNTAAAGVSALAETNGSANYTGGIRGVTSELDLYSTGTVNRANAYHAFAWATGPSLTSHLTGYNSFIEVDSATTNAYGFAHESGVYNTLTNNYGVKIVNDTGNGTITNNYGMFLEALTRGSTINAGLVIGETSGATRNTNLLLGTTTVPSGNYSIYNSSTDPNYFAGALTLGVITATTGSKLEVKDGHIASTQTTAPTPSVTGSGYSGASLTATSTDTKGSVTATVGAAVGTIVVTFQTGYATAPVCTVSPATATAQVDSGKMYVTSSTSTVTLNFVATPTGGSETWNYICMQ